MWKILYLLLVFLLSANADAAECESGWTAYKDETCLKLFTSLITYDEANEFCLSQGNDISKSAVVMVKEAEMQDLLANITQDIFDNVWLGGKSDENTSEFRWEDGDPLEYTNWQEGYPRNISDSVYCIELRPANDKDDIETNGQWGNVLCQKRNLVICQRLLSWTLQDAISEIIKLRTQHQEDNEILHAELETTKQELQTTQEDLQATKRDLRTTQQDLQTIQQDLHTTQLDIQATKQYLQATNLQLQATVAELQSVSSKVIPIGSIYVEYYSQPSPRTLWPGLTWEDVSSSFAGLFFRVSGSGSSIWGEIQSECAPSISQTQYQGGVVGSYPNPNNIPRSGWSEYGRAGRYYYSSETVYDEGLRFYTEACEVRPRNQAVRLWRRTG